MKNKIKEYWPIVAGGLALLATTVVFPAGYATTQIGQRFDEPNGMGLFNFLMVFGAFVLQKKFATRDLNRWQLGGTWLAGVFVAAIVVVTKALVADETQVKMMGAGYLIGTPANMLITLLAIVGYTLLFVAFFRGLAGLLAKINLPAKRVAYWPILLAMVVFWLLWTVPYFPGVITWDGFRQLLEVQHQRIPALDFTYYPTNHHPWFSTLIFDVLFILGRTVFGDANGGVMMIVIAQMIIGAPIYALATKYAFDRGGRILGWSTFAFFAGPIIAMNQQVVDKGTFYFTWVIAFFLVLLLITEKIGQRTMPAWWLFVAYAVAGFLLGMFRKDGSYVVILASLILLVLSFIKFRRGLVPVAVATVVILGGNAIWNNVAIPAMHVQPGSAGEALTIPMRQMAYVVLTDEASISKSDLKKIDKIMPIKHLKDRYDINQGDNLKSTFPVNSFLRGSAEIEFVKEGVYKKAPTPKIEKEISDFMGVWRKMLLQHPITFVEVYLQASSRYLNPFEETDDKSDGLMLGWGYMDDAYMMHPDWYKDYHMYLSEKDRENDNAAMWIYMRFPLVEMFIHTAMPFLMLIFGVVAMWLYKSKTTWLILLPGLALFMTATLAPVNGNMRYAMPGLLIIPLYMSFIVYYKHQRDAAK